MYRIIQLCIYIARSWYVCMYVNSTSSAAVALRNMLPSMPYMSRFFTIIGWFCILNSVLSAPNQFEASPCNQQCADVQPGDPQLQDVVTVDEHSICVHGRRVMLFSGEFHPFRLPSPGLWLDVFQKISSMGYTAVSFYVDWALVEGEMGQYRADGIFALEPFFDAAQEAGLYLIARPGPYINAETSGGGLPGWLQRNSGLLRSTAPDYLAATEIYLSNVLKPIEAAQITHGGPVIMVQYENEYSISDTPETINILTSLFVLGQSLTANTTRELSTELHAEYMEHVKNVFKNAGIVVPLMANDAVPAGNWAPGSGQGAADIYAIDDYPFPYGLTCESIHPIGRYLIYNADAYTWKVLIHRSGHLDFSLRQLSTTPPTWSAALRLPSVSPNSKEANRKPGTK